MRIHLDTDIGGDIDDLCALVFLLASPDAELTGVTTVLESAGRRAGYVRYVVAMAGREVPVAAGADVGSGSFREERSRWKSRGSLSRAQRSSSSDLLGIPSSTTSSS